MTRKKGKQKQRKKQASGNVQETGLQNNKMNSDAEDPQNGTRKQKSSVWTFTSYIRHPSWILDWLISGMFWLQLFFYQKAAGRLPLFLKEETKKSGQEITQHTTTIKDLRKNVDQLKEKNKELTESQKSLNERNNELEVDSKRQGEPLKEEISKLKDKEQELTIKNESLRKANKALEETQINLRDASEKLSNKVQLSEIKREQAESDIGKMKEDIETLKTQMNSSKDENKCLTETKKRLLQHITSLEVTKGEEIMKLQQLAITNQQKMDTKVETLEQEINDYRNRLYNLQHENEELLNKIALLTEQTRDLEAEKQDALKRLSEQVSVRLRDNNPNIVDLSDQCRPTKLAEMFSELYDNEWTNAYSALEDTFTEEHSIVILLDTVMLAYRFCENKLSDPWQSLVNWILDPSIPGAQQTTKWLKDSRKANVHKIVPNTNKDFCEDILKMCGNDNLKRFLNDTDICEYFIKCIELCLLMTATDPPIVLVCPGWKAPAVPQTSDSLKQDQAHLENEKESCSQSPSKHVEETFDINEKEEKSTVDDKETTGDKDFQSDETTINENAIIELGDSKDSESFTSMMEQDEDDSHKQEGQQNKDVVEESDEKKLDHRDECQEQKINGEDQETDGMIPALRVGDDEQDQHLQQTHLENAEGLSYGETDVVGDTASELKQPQSEDHMRPLDNPEKDDNSGLKESPVKEFDREIFSQTGNPEAVNSDTGHLHESEDPGSKIVNKYQDQGISQKSNEKQQQKHQHENEESHDEGTDEVKTQQEKTMTESDKETATPVFNANQTNVNEQMDNFVIVTHEQTNEEGDQRTEKQHKLNDIEKDDYVSYDNNLDDDEKDFEQHHQPQDDHEKEENSDVISVNNKTQELKAKELQHSDRIPNMDFEENKMGFQEDENSTDENKCTEGEGKQKLDEPTDLTGEEVQNMTHDEEVESRKVNTILDSAIDETRLNVGADHDQQENGTSVSEDESTKQEKVIERQLFDKNTFREYTKRGQYIDYIVWPAMSLYENGELLSKGVAQGSKEQFRKPETEEWTWVKTLQK